MTRICETCKHVRGGINEEPCRSCLPEDDAETAVTFPMWERGSYTSDEQRVADFIVEQSGGIVGAGDDPIGFLIASYRLLVTERNEARVALDRRTVELLHANSELTELNRILRRQVEGKDLIIDAMATAVRRERRIATEAIARATPFGHTHNDKLLFCSFCGKKQGEVSKLIAGPTVFICNECVDLCVEIIEAEGAKAA